MTDTDEPDRSHPTPSDEPHDTDLSGRNLAAVWTPTCVSRAPLVSSSSIVGAWLGP